MLIGNVLGTTIDDEDVRRILAKHYRPLPGKGPSWLLPIGNSHNRLWSMNLFRLESCFLHTYWVLVVMDQFTQKIIGASIHRGPIDGGTICFMFNKKASGKNSPKYLSTDYDPLFLYWLWKVNLEIHYYIEQIKTVPFCPCSHPFIERLIGCCLRKFTDNNLFWAETDLVMKLAPRRRMTIMTSEL